MQKSNSASIDRVVLNTQMWKMYGENIWKLISFPPECFDILWKHIKKSKENIES